MQNIVQSVLEKMGNVSKPHLKVWTILLTTILVLHGKVNFTNLSRYSPLSERTYRRFFAKVFNFCRFNQVLIQLYVPENHPLLAVMDASFSAKSGKKTFGRDWFYRGCHGRAEVGLEVSVIAVVDVVTNDSYALSAQQTHDQRQNPLLTRVDYALVQLEQARDYMDKRIKYLAVDSAYAIEKFVTGALHSKLQVVSKLRKDANLRYLYEGPQKARGAKRKYDGKVDLSSQDFIRRATWVKELDGADRGVHLYSLVVWHVSLKRKIRLVYLSDLRNLAKPGYVLLFSTDLEQNPEEILEFYRLRFQIEFIFRDAKQFTGFSHCQARNEQALDVHFNVSLMVLNIAVARQRGEMGKSEPMVLSMTSIKRQAFNDYLLDLFIHKLGLPQTLIKSHHNFQELRNTGGISA